MDGLTDVLKRIAVALEEQCSVSKQNLEQGAELLRMRRLDFERHARIEDEWRVENKRLAKQLNEMRSMASATRKLVAGYRDAVRGFATHADQLASLELAYKTSLHQVAGADEGDGQ